MTQRRRNIVFGVLFAAAVGAACLCLVRIEAKSRQQVLNNALCDAVIMQRTAAVADLLRHGADPNCRQQPASFQDQAESISSGVWRFFHGGEQPTLYLTPLGLAVLNGPPETVKKIMP